MQLCLALKYSHEHKVLHRDLKASNVFLTADDQVKLGDFGTAKNLTNTTQCLHAFVGTPLYMPPEIINNRAYSYKADIWSLGVIFYELLALKPPFMDYTYQSLLVKICNAPIDPLPESYSSELRNFVMNILERDETKRPSINELFETEFLRNEMERQQQLCNSILSASPFQDLQITDIQLKSEFEQLKTYRFSEFISSSLMSAQKSNKLLKLVNQNLARPSGFGSANNNHILSLSNTENGDEVFYESFINQSNVINGEVRGSELLTESPLSHLIEKNNKMIDSAAESTRKATTLQSSKPFSGFNNACDFTFSDLDDQSNIRPQGNSEFKKSINLKISLSGLQLKSINSLVEHTNNLQEHPEKIDRSEQPRGEKNKRNKKSKESPRSSFRPISLLDSDDEAEDPADIQLKEIDSHKVHSHPIQKGSIIFPDNSDILENMDKLEDLPLDHQSKAPTKSNRKTGSQLNLFKDLRNLQLSSRITPKQATPLKAKDIQSKASDKKIPKSHHQRQGLKYDQEVTVTSRSKFSRKLLTRVKSQKDNLQLAGLNRPDSKSKLLSSMQMTPISSSQLKNIRFLPSNSLMPNDTLQRKSYIEDKAQSYACDYCGSQCPIHAHKHTEKQIYQRLHLSQAEILRKKCAQRFQGKFESIYCTAKRFVIHYGLKSIQQALFSPIQLLKLAAGFDSQLQCSLKDRETMTEIIKVCVLEFQSANCNYAN